MVGEPQLPFGVTNVDHSDPAEAPDHAARKDFLREKVAADAASDRFGRPIHTRFPPEPNGFLHIGHAKSICLNFGVAQEFHGLCNLRFDDTNPTTEDIKYVEAIRNDVRWLGFEWAEERFASQENELGLYAFRAHAGAAEAPQQVHAQARHADRRSAPSGGQRSARQRPHRMAGLRADRRAEGRGRLQPLLLPFVGARC